MLNLIYRIERKQKMKVIKCEPNWEAIIAKMESQRRFYTAKEWEKTSFKAVLDEAYKSRN